MNFRTPVDLPENTLTITPHSHVMLTGSCFTEHIGKHFNESLPPAQVQVNPNGILYNPGSIFNALSDWLSPCYHFAPAQAFEGTDGLWHHWQYSTLWTAPSCEALRACLEQQWIKTHQLLEHLDVLFVTFSTDHVYCLNEGPLAGTWVANCHKQPGKMFTETILDLENLCSMWDSLITQLHDKHPSVHVVFTLSPYRYAKYGMHENALSKARLLLLIDHLCHNHKQTSYFPAYEIVTDELRDYRFYTPDMLHPTEQTADYVWERFCDWAFTKEMKIYALERQRLLRDLNHKPLHEQSAEYLKFQQKMEERRKLFETKWNEKWT